MSRLVNAASAAVLVALALPAGAQVSNALDREAGLPAGLALPVLGAATAEEPSALGTNPAGVGFIDRLALQYFHEREATEDSRADGLYAADGVGPLGVGFGMEWMHPGSGDGARYRRTTWALTAGDRRTFSLGFAWTFYGSPDAELEALRTWDVGLTLRPWRHLSLAAASLGRGGRLAGEALPARYDFGLATRLLRDRLTLSADLLADDEARDDFRATHLAFGAGLETRLGVALGVQVQAPISDAPDVRQDTTALVSLTWNGPHVGWTGGALPIGDRTGWLAGVRASGERYRAAPDRGSAPSIDLGRELSRRTGFLVLGERDPYGLLVLRLSALAADADVGAVVVRIEDLDLGAGRIEELRAALAEIARTRPVLAYVVGPGTAEYWLATAATAIAAPPGSALMVNGLSSSQLYLAAMLARLGIRFDVVAAGAYKTAPEPLVREGSTPEAREVRDALLDDVGGRLVADVARARKLDPAAVRALVDRGLLSAEEAKEARLVDEVLWPDELEGWARRASGRRVDLGGAYRPEPRRLAERWGPAATIEVIRVEGAIAMGRSRGVLGRDAIAGAETIAGQVRRAAEDRSVKAIVLRVDSPGGDGTASDLVWRAVTKARERKPVIASMGDVAASGGYLVAVGADTVLAEASTLTGSIGVFALKPDLSGLLAKLSATREASARGEAAELLSLAKPWSAVERAAVERQVASFYRLFLERVAEGRRLSREQVEPLARGRVWTGQQALERGLVDGLGSLADAIALARTRAGLGADDVVEVRRAEARRDFGELGLELARAAAPPPSLVRAVGAIPELRALALLAELGPILALPLDPAVEWGAVGEP
jgi:protease-4